MYVCMYVCVGVCIYYGQGVFFSLVKHRRLLCAEKLTCMYVCMYVCTGEVKASLVSILKKGPKTIQDFKAISQEEGVAIAD